METNISKLAELGQSIWYDNIARSLLDSGELERLIRENVVTGLTSNPTIFEKAVSGSGDYDETIRPLARRGAGVEEIYLALVTRDIRDAADLLLPVYERSSGRDGYVSVEVSPELADDSEGTVTDAMALAERMDRKNLMIKVPGTAAGARAVKALIARGISVNVTLLFSLSQYRASVEAYMAGLEERVRAGLPLESVASVASFFVSRVDTLVDRVLRSQHPDQADSLCGKAAIANAALVYQESRTLFSGPRWDNLVQHGARLQRVLWASTSTKDPSYPDTLYVDNLVARDTINTVPPATLTAFIDHGNPLPPLENRFDEARGLVNRLGDLGIDLEQVGTELQEQGVEAFKRSMASLLQVIARRRTDLA